MCREYEPFPERRLFFRSGTLVVGGLAELRISWYRREVLAIGSAEEMV
jgi:hypothetical protein